MIQRRLRSGSPRPAAPTLLRVYLLVGVAVLSVGFLFYFQTLARRVDEQTELMSEMLARFVVVAATMTAATDDSTGALQYQDVLRRANFPIIVSDSRGMPMVWNESQIGVPLIPIDRLLAMDPATPDAAVARVIAIQQQLDRRHQPIALRMPGSTVLAGEVHYGSPPLSRELAWVPWVAIAAAALFGFTALASLRSIKRSEQSFIWAGLAKESAHQMGTPISSLLGWVELLRSEGRPDGATTRIPTELYHEIVEEVERDAHRLDRVAARFSQVGSAPRLTRGLIEPVVEQTVDYFQSRLPRQTNTVDLRLDLGPNLPEVDRNEVLVGWVIENLIKNAMNAVDKREGKVTLTVRGSEDGVSVAVRDNGRGVQPGLEGQIFRPGVSTRERGWGLGLALSQRIIRDYHGGRLELSWTKPGEGAEFTLTLPAARS